MLEATLLYVGGLTIGGFMGYHLAAEVRGQARVFGGDDAVISIGIIAVCAVSAPFILNAIMRKWKALTYPVLGLCTVAALIHLGWIVWALVAK